MSARNDPYAQFNFLVEIDGVTVAGFTEVSGLTAESEVIEYRTGADEPTVRKLPGLLSYGNITLQVGYTDNTDLWEWRKTTLDGATQRRDGSIILLNESREEALRWNFANGWISKYDGPSLNSTTNEAAIETVEITIERLELA